MKGDDIMVPIGPTNPTIISNPMEPGNPSGSPSSDPSKKLRVSGIARLLLTGSTKNHTLPSILNVPDTQDSASTEKTILFTNNQRLKYKITQQRKTEMLPFSQKSFVQARLLLQDTTQKLNLKPDQSLAYYPLHTILLTKEWICFEQLEIVQLMLNYKTETGQELDINATDTEERTVLFIALFNLNTKNKDSIVYELLTHGADIGCLHKSNRTVLHLAINQYSNIQSKLTTTSFEKENPRHILLTAQLEQIFDMIELLLKFYKLSDFNITDSKNKTVLICAQENKLDHIVKAIQTRQLELKAMETTPLTQPESKPQLQHRPQCNFPALVPISSANNIEFLKACKAGNFAKVEELLKSKTEKSDEAIDLNLGFLTSDRTQIATGFLHILRYLIIQTRTEPKKENEGYLKIARHILTKHKQQIDFTLVNGLGKTALNIILEDQNLFPQIKEELVILILKTSSTSLATGKPNNINYINCQGYSYVSYSMTTTHVNTRIITQLIDQENIDLTIQYRLPVRGGTILHQLIYFSYKKISLQRHPKSKAFVAFKKLLSAITDPSILELTNKDNESVRLYAKNHCMQCFTYLNYEFPPNPSDPKNLSAHVPSEAEALRVPNSKTLASSSNRKRALQPNSSSLLPGQSTPPSSPTPPENKKRKKDSNDVMDSQDEDSNVVIASQDENPGVVMASQDENPGFVMASQDEDSNVVMVSPDEDQGVVMASQDEDQGVVTASQGKDPGIVMASQGEDPGIVMAAEKNTPFLIPMEITYLEEEGDPENKLLSQLEPTITADPLSFESLLGGVDLITNSQVDTWID